MGSLLLEDEENRLEALRRYRILNTPPDVALDHIAELAVDLLRVPMVMISLVDNDRIWFKSHRGLEVQQVGREAGLCASAIRAPHDRMWFKWRHGIQVQQVRREAGLCASAIRAPEVYYIRDAIHDAPAQANPLVAGPFGVRFYAVAPLRTHDGLSLGTLCIADREPRELATTEVQMLTKLAALIMDHMGLQLSARKVSELEQAERRISEQLRQANEALVQSEERFRDLFDEAPIAYVHEGLDSRFIRANRTAMRILGLKPEEISGTFGTSLVPDTPDAQRRLREALDSVGRGTDTSGVVLELRRKDDGKPVWVQWWSRRTAGGNCTRTMFVDITERVLIEQEQGRLQDRNAYLCEEIRSEHNFADIIGDSPGLQKVKEQVQLVAPTDAAVLVTGESGTGKELVARAVHDHSERKRRPLIKLNCSAVPEGLFESEFFGHVRGAFTGAFKDKLGRFELADGGTLFLDEVGDVPLAMQAKLLRVLQEKELERVGDTRTRKVNVRIIAATNRDLKKEVDAGRFREDLFYRLSVFPIAVPPLRQRRDDIPPLVEHFLRQSARRMNRPAMRISQAALGQLTAHDWPGNVRELQNTIERAVILSPGGPLRFDLAKSTRDPVVHSVHTAPPAVLLTRKEMKGQERDSIAAALKQTGGKIFGPGGAADLLGMKPTTLASRITALKLNRKTGE